VRDCFLPSSEWSQTQWLQPPMAGYSWKSLILVRQMLLGCSSYCMLMIIIRSTEKCQATLLCFVVERDTQQLVWAIWHARCCMTYTKTTLWQLWCYVICRGFAIASNDRQHVMKPVSVQVMWLVMLLYFIVNFCCYCTQLFVDILAGFTYLFLQILCVVLSVYTVYCVW